MGKQRWSAKRCRIGSYSSGSFRDTKKRDSYTKKIVIKAKMQEISKKFCVWEGDKISLENAGVSRRMRET